jgi:uncharacterized membrane protein YbaN (DUF454 family)
MKLFRFIFLLLLLLTSSGYAHAEPTDRPWILSDKIIEFAVPLFIITIVLQTLVTILKIRSNQKLRDKLLEKNVHEALMQSFNETNKITKLEPLKWAFLTLSFAIAFFIIDSLGQYNSISELLSLTILFGLTSAAFVAYYFILNKRK